MNKRIDNPIQRREFFERHVMEEFENERALFEQIAYMQHNYGGDHFHKTRAAAHDLIMGGTFLVYYDDMNDLRKEHPGCIDGRLSAENAWNRYVEHCTRAICRIVNRFNVQPGDVHEIAANVMYHKFIDNHGADLYIKKTPVSAFIIEHMENKSLLSTFTDAIDGDTWYDLPFCYNPAVNGGNNNE